ncbi:MAG: LTA synthase family protein [Acholeplasmataceae bacterium]|jgi:phosphoglycerol transferase MdoB-like AlkP superfamily enzyme|nr:LTA synthase family protein [Acholeplasmataceae bacterium]
MHKKVLGITGSVVLLILIYVFRLILNTYDNVWNYFAQWVLFIEAIGIISTLFALYRNQIISFFKERKDLSLLLGSLVVMELLFMLKNASQLGMTYPFGLILSLLLLVIIYTLSPQKIKLILGIFLIFIFASYTIGQDVYLRIFNDYFSFKEALTLREGLESGESMYRFNWLHPLIVVVASSALWFFIRTHQKSMQQHAKIKPMILAMLTSLIIILLGLNMRIPLSGQTMFTSDYYLYQTVYSRKDVAQKFGVFHLMGRDFIDALTPTFSTKRNINAIDDYFMSHPKTVENHAYQGIFENKNFIFILAESYDEIALDPVLTPNLYRLKNEGFDFQNHFTPVFQRTTSDTEFIFNTGLIPSIEDGPTVSVFRENSYTISLAHLFKQKGYVTQAFHGNYKEFYRRDVIYMNYGYDQFYGRDELGLSIEDGKYDTRFFDEASELIMPSSSPFMSFIITFSGHSPYTLNHVVAKEHINKVNQLYPNDDETMNLYRATQIELDLMIGMLFDDLEERGLLDDTVILLSGDHYPYTMPQEVYETYSGIKENYLKHQGNLYIWSSELSHQVITDLTTSFDILPTLNVLFNLSGNPTYYVGRDMFSNDQSVVLYKDYSYFDGENYVSIKDPYMTDDQTRKYSYMYQIYKKILRANYFD